MSSKIRAFFGLNDSGDDVVESHRKRRTDYMKKIQRLVVPEDAGDEAAPENIVTAPEPETENTVPAPASEAADASENGVSEAAPQSEAVEAEQKTEEQEEREEETVEMYRPQPARAGARAKKEKKSFASRFLRVGDSLRRPQEDDQSLILIRTGALSMLEDIEDALVKGQTVLLDFEREDRQTAESVIKKLVNFTRLHKGAFYTVTRTSMLLSLRRDSVTEWRPGGDGEEQ